MSTWNFPRHHAASSRQRGITLIELMIVVVIVGILASIAYPGYQEYTRRAKRAEGKALLSEIAARMERYYFDNNTYTDDLTEIGYSSDAPGSAEGNYTASVEDGPSGDIATSYTLRITPAGTHHDTRCGELTLDSRGLRGSSVEDAAETCWR